MKRHILPLPIVLALPLLLCVSSCATGVGQSFSRVFGTHDDNGPGEVDDLLGRIEQLYVECELSQQSARAALETLQTLTSPEFRGDPVSAYTAFSEAVSDSEAQAEQLHKAIKPMKRAAEPFFEQWATDLAMYSSMDMRLHSQNRLTETRDRYDAILAAVDPAADAYDAFNANLSDHALFLSHDFNAGAVSSIEGEVVGLSEHADELDVYLVQAREAAQEYVRAAALRGQVESGRESGIER